MSIKSEKPLEISKMENQSCSKISLSILHVNFMADQILIWFLLAQPDNSRGYREKANNSSKKQQLACSLGEKLGQTTQDTRHIVNGNNPIAHTCKTLDQEVDLKRCAGIE